MNEGIIRRIDQLLKEEEITIVKDDANIIIPAGMDTKIRAQAYRECLRIIREEDNECRIMAET